MSAEKEGIKSAGNLQQRQQLHRLRACELAQQVFGRREQTFEELPATMRAFFVTLNYTQIVAPLLRREYHNRQGRGITYSVLARKYRIDESVVFRIVSGETPSAKFGGFDEGEEVEE